MQLTSAGHCINSNISQTIGGLLATNVHNTYTKSFADICTKLVVLIPIVDKSNNVVLVRKEIIGEELKYYLGVGGTTGILLTADLMIEQSKCYSTTISTISNIVSKIKVAHEEYLKDSSTKKMWVLEHNLFCKNWLELCIKEIETKEGEKTLKNWNEKQLFRLTSHLPDTLLRKIVYLIPAWRSIFRRPKITSSSLQIASGENNSTFHIEIEVFIPYSKWEIVFEEIKKKGLMNNSIIVIRIVVKSDRTVVGFAGENYEMAIGFHTCSNNMTLVKMKFEHIISTIQFVIGRKVYSHLGKACPSSVLTAITDTNPDELQNYLLRTNNILEIL